MLFSYALGAFASQQLFASPEKKKGRAGRKTIFSPQKSQEKVAAKNILTAAYVPAGGANRP